MRQIASKISRKYSSRAFKVSKAAKSFACPASSTYARNTRRHGWHAFSNDLRDEEKAKRYFQLHNRYLAFKEQWDTRTRPEEIISTVPDLISSKQDSSTTTPALWTPLNLFNVTPKLTQAAISQKPEKESSTPLPPLNRAFLTPPPTVGFSDLVKISFVRKYVFCHCQKFLV